MEKPTEKGPKCISFLAVNSPAKTTDAAAPAGATSAWRPQLDLSAPLFEPPHSSVGHPTSAPGGSPAAVAAAQSSSTAGATSAPGGSLAAVAAAQSSSTAGATSAGPNGPVTDGQDPEEWTWAQVADGFTPDLNYIEIAYTQVRNPGAHLWLYLFRRDAHVARKLGT
eukprot:1184246-Prorocentrum_minimum.AAC.1